MKNGPFPEGTSLPIFPRRISCHQKIASLKGVANFSTPIKGGEGQTFKLKKALAVCLRIKLSPGPTGNESKVCS